MLAILFRVKVKPDRRLKLVDFLKWDFEECEKEEGTLRFDVWIDPTDECAVYVYEAYRDQSAFDTHKEGRPFERWSKEVEPEWIIEKRILFEGAPLCLLNKREGGMKS